MIEVTDIFPYIHGSKNKHHSDKITASKYLGDQGYGLITYETRLVDRLCHRLTGKSRYYKTNQWFSIGCTQFIHVFGSNMPQTLQIFW